MIALAAAEGSAATRSPPACARRARGQAAAPGGAVAARGSLIRHGVTLISRSSWRSEPAEASQLSPRCGAPAAPAGANDGVESKCLFQGEASILRVEARQHYLGVNITPAGEHVRMAVLEAICANEARIFPALGPSPVENQELWPGH